MFRKKRNNCILKKWPALLIIALAFVLLFIFILKTTRVAIDSYYVKEFDKQVEMYEKALDMEASNLLEIARTVSSHDNIIKAIKEKDTNSLISLFGDVKKNHGVRYMMAVDSEGVALHRLKSHSQRGDYIFQTSVWGEELSKGNEIVGTIKGISYPYFIGGGVPIIKNGEVIGAIIVAQALNNKFLNEFEKKYLLNGQHLIVYSDEGKIVSHSDKEKGWIDFFVKYLNSATRFVVEPSEEAEIINISSRNYIVKPIQFGYLANDSGGLLILSEHEPWHLRISLIAILLLIISLVFGVYKKKQKIKFKNLFCFNNFIIMLLLVLLFLVLLLVSFVVDRTDSRDYPISDYLIYNSVLRLEPETGVYDVGFDQRISIVLDTGGERINTIGAEIKYDPEIIRVKDIITLNSICEEDTFIRKKINHLAGTISIACIIPSPGFNNEQGILADLLITPIKKGAFALEFLDDTQVLAHDGLGTDVLRSSINGSYQVAQLTNSKNKNGDVIIFSSSHPNSEKWYNKRDIRLSWCGGSSYEYGYILDQSKSTTPKEINLIKEESVRLQVQSDGIYYFHLASYLNRKIVNVNHYKIKIDSTSPEIAEFIVSADEIKSGEIIRAIGKARDTMSGVQSYYLKVDDDLLLPVSFPLFIPFGKSGDHELLLRVFDNAENYSDEIIEIKVKRKYY